MRFSNPLPCYPVLSGSSVIHDIKKKIGIVIGIVNGIVKRSGFSPGFFRLYENQYSRETAAFSGCRGRGSREGHLSGI